MKCKDFEREIYLYQELLPSEKKVVDDHVAVCKTCCELLVTVQNSEALISQIAFSKPQTENSSRLTSNIMQAISNKQKKSASWINSLFLRYAMTTASFVLVIAFCFESLSNTQPVTKRHSSAKTVTLNSTSLAKSYRAKKEKPEQPSLYACVKSGECYSLIESFRKKTL